MSKSNREIWIDALRLTAGVSMVALHATADPSGQPWAAYSEAERVGPMVLRAIIYTARTELFLIISLFLLLMSQDKAPRSYGNTIQVQARRLLAPFAFWTIFYAFYGLIKASQFQYFDSAVDQLMNPVSWVGYALLGSVKYHMHFIPTLFGLVLFYPLFRLAVRYPVLGLSVLLFLMMRREIDGYIYSNYWGTEVLPYLIRLTKTTTYIGYGFVAGAAFGLWKRADGKSMERWFLPVLSIGLVLFGFKIIATKMTIESGAWAFGYVPGYWADFLMPVILFSGSLALAHRQWPKILSRMAPYSFGIYLCHPIFLDLAEIALHGSTLVPLAQVLAKIGFVLPMTCILVVILRRIPLLAWTIGLGPLPRFGSSVSTLTEEI